VCEADADGNLISINERTSIFRNEQGKITYEDESGLHEVSEDSLVSMNFFGFSPAIFPVIEKQFQEFLDENINKPKAEFFIPLVGDKYIKSGLGVIKVIPTDAQWFGVTYKEDAPSVQKSIDTLVQSKEYPAKIWD
ncbi:MAG: nucleotidyltransferase, partial [Segetibacter sp.]